MLGSSSGFGDETHEGFRDGGGKRGGTVVYFICVNKFVMIILFVVLCDKTQFSNASFRLSRKPKSYTFSTAARLHTCSKSSFFATDLTRGGSVLGGCPSRVRTSMCLLSSGQVVGGSSSSGNGSEGAETGEVEENECTEVRT